MRRWLLTAALPLLLVGNGASGQPTLASIDGSIKPSTLPPLFNQTTATCGTSDGPITPASGTLPSWPHNFLIENVQQAPGSGTTNTAHVFINWPGGVSSSAGLDLAPLGSDERVTNATPHCSAPSGPVTIQIGW